MAHSDWDHVYDEGQGQDPPDQQLFEVLERLTSGRALDLGCGVGSQAVELARRGWSVLGVDLVKKAIEIARKVTDSSLDVTFEVGDMTTWETDESYDLVLFSYSIPPAGPAREGAMSKAIAALAPGGHLVITEFDAVSMTWGKPSDFATVDSMTKTLSGLEVVSVESVPTEPHQHGDFTSHTETKPRAVIGVARKPLP